MNLLILKVRSEVKFLSSTFSYLVGGNKNVYNFCVSSGTADNEHILSESRHYLKKLWLFLHILIYWYIDPQTTCYNAMILMLHLYVSHLKLKKINKKNLLRHQKRCEIIQRVQTGGEARQIYELKVDTEVCFSPQQVIHSSSQPDSNNPIRKWSLRVRGHPCGAKQGCAVSPERWTTPVPY